MRELVVLQTAVRHDMLVVLRPAHLASVRGCCYATRGTTSFLVNLAGRGVQLDTLVLLQTGSRGYAPRISPADGDAAM
jgi:hypothetical protein